MNSRVRALAGTIATTFGVVATLQTLLGAPHAAATTCTFASRLHEVTITIDADSDATVTVDDGTVVADNAILVDLVACGTATSLNTASIKVMGKPRSDEELVIDNGGFGLSTGKAFPDTIAWSVDLGTGAGDTLTIGGTSSDDALVFENTSFDMNGGAGTIARVERLDVFGHQGDDTIDASKTSMIGFLIGGDDDDVIAPGTNIDVLDGTAGIDTLSYETRTTAIAIDNGQDFSGFDANGDCDVADPGEEIDNQFGFEILRSGSGDDCLNGDDLHDIMAGNAGNDRLRGKGGPDTLSGGTAKDRLTGGTGIDVGFGGPGADICVGVEQPSSCAVLSPMRPG